jgi:hypothetical protein
MMTKSRKSSFFLTLAMAFAMAGTSGPMHGQATARPSGLLRMKNPVPGQYIVVLKDPETAAQGRPDRAASARGLSEQYGGQVGFVYEAALHGFSARMTEDQALALSHDPRVAYIEEDSLVQANTMSVTSQGDLRTSHGNVSGVSGQSGTNTLTDFNAGIESNPPWGLDRIDQRTGLDGFYHFWGTGFGVHAYIIGTGILPTHQEFDTRATAAADFVGDGRNGIDCNGGGTYLAGIIGGLFDGVAKKVSLYGVRVSNCFASTTTSQFIAGVNWVAANRVLPAVALLEHEIAADASLDTAVQNAINSGITFVVGAGNNADDAGNYSPARIFPVITVGATNSSDTRWSFSNYGSSLDLFAPGVDIESASINGTSSFVVGSDTQAAAAHVAGVAAMFLQRNPGATPGVIASAINVRATQGAVFNLGTGSPNKLLFGLDDFDGTVVITGQEQHDCKIQNATTECGGGIIFDAGTVSITINGRTYSAAYGKLSTTTSIAQALAASINNDPSVSATSAAGGILLTSRTSSCFTVSSTSSTSMPDRFNISFSGVVFTPPCY